MGPQVVCMVRAERYSYKDALEKIVNMTTFVERGNLAGIRAKEALAKAVRG